MPVTHATHTSSESALDADWTELPLAPSPAPRRITTRRILLGTVACGLTGDAVFHAAFPIPFLALYFLVLAAGIAWVAKSHVNQVPRIVQWLLGMSAIFSLLMVVRDAEMLTFWNLVTSAGLLALAMFSMTPFGMVTVARLREFALAFAHMGWYAAFDGFRFLNTDARNVFTVSTLRWHGARLVLRGVILAIAVAVVFTSLLSLGDQVFGNAVAKIVRWDAGAAATHLFAFAFTAWPVMGMLWGTTIGAREPLVRALPEWRELNRIDVLSVLGAMNTLFALFVAVQLRVLFGGQAYVLATTGLTVAEYARNGFFVLFATAGLVLVLLLALNAIMRGDTLGSWKLSRNLSYSLLSLVGVMMVSSAVRMTLYVQRFGASTDRLYAFGAMAWLACVFVWFSRTVLRNNPTRFAFGTLISACTALAAFNAINPDAVVMRYNIARAKNGTAIDLTYASRLSADAVPLLVNTIANVPAADLGTVFTTTNSHPCHDVAKVIARWNEPAPSSRTWTASRWRAYRAVNANMAALTARACPVTQSVAPPAR